ncbi:MAB_1171c family putative transporter [Streptomyces sp. NPDC007971]|uniref:MAB_1171c family putative transporter n=1 Tax=Streptomyces sp. NPDC007971 TaxID=3364799 RepID=UPI0036EAC2E1
MSGWINYVSCGILGLGLLAKIPDLVRRRRDPFLLAISCVLSFAALCFLFSAPRTIGFINSVSGVPNLAAPLTYGAITAYSAASLVLIVQWRGGPNTARTARNWILGYAAVLVGIAAMFALGRAPVERRTDFDTYYATTPYIAELIVLYLVAHLVAVVVTAYRSLSWARQVKGHLRAGLLMMGMGTVLGAGYSAIKIVAVVARWRGHDWARLGTTVSPACAGLGAALTVAGTVIPVAGPYLANRARCWRAYARLGPLEGELTELLTREYLRAPRPFWPSATRWLTWRQTTIYNGLYYLERYVDRALYRDTYLGQLDAAGDAHRAEAVAWATAITAATRAAGDGEDGFMAVGVREPLPARPDLPALLSIADALPGCRGVTALRLDESAAPAGPV